MTSNSYFHTIYTLIRHSLHLIKPLVITCTTVSCFLFARLIFRFTRRKWPSTAPTPRRRRHPSVSEITANPSPRFLTSSTLQNAFVAIKHLLWDSALYLLLAWLINLISVVFALILSLAQTLGPLIPFKRKKINVCVATSLSTTQLHAHHAEATHVNPSKHTPSISPYSYALMVPSALSCSNSRKSLVLDLDETLVHSQFKLTEHCDLRLEVRVDHIPAVFYVSKRPYLDVFLRTVAQWYDIVIFTASLQKYGDPLITVLDTDRVVKRRIFRQHCVKRNGNFVKDLTIVEPNLANVLIVDNSPAAYSIQPSNAIPIEPWYNDQNDDELLNLLPLLHAVAFLNDVRSLLDLRLTGGVLAGRNRSRKVTK